MKIDTTGLTGSSTTNAFNMLLGGSNVTSQKDIQYIEPDKLLPYPNQPFKPYNDDDLQELANDIKQNGILSPVIVRPLGNDYQILAGHNRTAAARLAGLDTIPCIVKTVDDDTARLIMVNTNLNQRQQLLPSEKAWAYKMQMDTLKNQGTRTDLTATEKSDTAADIAALTTDSRANIYRYIRLTKLIKPLLDMIDNGGLPFRAGVKITYISSANQEKILEFVNENDIKISLKQAEKLLDLSNFSDDELAEVFMKRSAGATAEKIQLSRKDLLDYFAKDISNEDVKNTILQALKQYFDINA